MAMRQDGQSEPEQLKRGKAFHKKIQAEWEAGAQGNIASERWVLMKNGRKGRVDVFVNDDNADGCIAIIEIKASDWDSMSNKAVRRNIRRQIRQVWKYIESQIDNGEYVSTGEHKGVSPGIVFPKRPADSTRQERIETLFLDEGIVVVWDDGPV